MLKLDSFLINYFIKNGIEKTFAAIYLLYFISIIQLFALILYTVFGQIAKFANINC